MQWSGRGTGRERVPDVPYVSNTGSNGAPAPARGRKRRPDRSPSVSSESSSDGPSFTYVELSNSDAGAVEYMKYVGRLFDDDEDGGTFKIVSVCDMRKVGTRRSTNVVYAFKYVNIDDDSGEFLYTPVREMLNSYWCKWKAVASQRIARGSRRSEDMGEPESTSSSSANCNSGRTLRTSNR